MDEYKNDSKNYYNSTSMVHVCNSMCCNEVIICKVNGILFLILIVQRCQILVAIYSCFLVGNERKREIQFIQTLLKKSNP